MFSVPQIDFKAATRRAVGQCSICNSGSTHFWVGGITIKASINDNPSSFLILYAVAG